MGQTRLLRRLRDKDKWAELSESPLWEEGDCPPELLAQVYDNRDGISVYEVETEADIKRVVAVMSRDWGFLKDCCYALLPKQDVKALGLQIKTSAISTFDNETKGRHRDLVGVTGKQVISLASMINHTAEIDVITRNEIIKYINEALQNRIFDRAPMFKKSKDCRHGDFLIDLWQKNLLDLKQSTT